MKELHNIETKILTIRDLPVMLDRDLAELYGVETKALNQAVKRNIERFPDEFRFQMNVVEYENWRSQNVTSKSDKMGLRRPPYLFTEQGVAMLATILKSDRAIKASIEIMKAFVAMRRYIASNIHIFQEIDAIRKHQYLADQRIDELFSKMEQTALPPKYGLFFDGQVFDAYVFVADLIKSANRSIRLVDNYLDESVLLMLSKRNEAVGATIFTEKITPQLKLDLRKHNAQYPPVNIKRIEKVHDRFLLIDDKRLYHFGASFKDLGKKLFVVTLIEEPALVSAVGKMLS